MLSSFGSSQWYSILGKTHLPILFPLPLLAMEHKNNKLKWRYSIANFSMTVSAKKYQLLDQLLSHGYLGY
jgi:hypothetical protein